MNTKAFEELGMHLTEICDGVYANDKILRVCIDDICGHEKYGETFLIGFDYDESTKTCCPLIIRMIDEFDRTKAKRLIFDITSKYHNLINCEINPSKDDFIGTLFTKEEWFNDEN